MRPCSENGSWLTMAHKLTSSVYVFDADGIVIEPWGFAKALSAEHGITLDDTREFFAGPFQQCLTGDANLLDSITPYINQWRWPYTPQAFIEFWMESDNLPNAQVVGRIQELRDTGALCYLASNQEQIRATYIRERMGFDSIFDRLFFSCELGCAKPDKPFFDAITANIDVEPGDVQFWDDSESHVRAAISVGWNARVYEGVESFDFGLQA